jgi:hypothetical protein
MQRKFSGFWKENDWAVGIARGEKTVWEIGFYRGKLFGGQGQPVLRLLIIAYFHEGRNILYPKLFIRRRNFKKVFVDCKRFFFSSQSFKRYGFCHSHLGTLGRDFIDEGKRFLKKRQRLGNIPFQIDGFGIVIICSPVICLLSHYRPQIFLRVFPLVQVK